MSNALITQRLTTDQLYAAVHDLNPSIAVFDCDGTLWSGDAGSGFMNWSIEKGLVSREAIDWIDRRYRGYLRGEVSELAICGEMVQLYQGLREEEMRRAAREFFAAKIEPCIFAELRGLIASLQANGVQIWAVSSTNDWVIEEGMRRFNIPADHVLAACVDVRNGVVTDVIRDIPTDEGKVVALARVGITSPDAVFGNSIHDAAMLAVARRAFPVNPSPALLDRSALAGWSVYYPAAVSPA